MVKPINQRYTGTVTLDATGAGIVQITPRADFAVQQTSWRVQGGTGLTKQSTAQVELNGDFWQGTYSGNNDSSPAARLITPSDQIECTWTGGTPGATATLNLFGLEYPQGQGIPPPTSGGGPSNPILGGTTLIRDAIQSPGYVPGVTGWSVNADGTVEFNNGTFRGSVLIGNIVRLNAGGLHIEGSGRQFDINFVGGFIARASPDNGGLFQAVTDPGNGAAAVFLRPPNSTIPGVTLGVGGLFAERFDTSDCLPTMTLLGPSVTGFTAPRVILSGANSTKNVADIELRGDLTHTSGDFQVRGNYVGGWVAGDGTLASNTPVSGGAGEAVQFTARDANGNQPTYLAGHTYRAVVYGQCQTSAVANSPVLSLRKTTVTGTRLGWYRTGPTVANFSYEMAASIPFQVGPANVTASLVLTLTGGAGTVQVIAALDQASGIDIIDEGPTSPQRAGYLPMLT